MASEQGGPLKTMGYHGYSIVKQTALIVSDDEISNMISWDIMDSKSDKSWDIHGYTWSFSIGYGGKSCKSSIFSSWLSSFNVQCEQPRFAKGVLIFIVLILDATLWPGCLDRRCAVPLK